jgi:hypothetical protein
MDLLDQLPKIAEIITRGGVAGILLVVVGVLVWEIKRLRVENMKTYNKLDKYRTGFALCRAACEFHDIKVDLSVMADIENDK